MGKLQAARRTGKVSWSTLRAVLLLVSVQAALGFSAFRLLVRAYE